MVDTSPLGRAPAPSKPVSARRRAREGERAKPVVDGARVEPAAQSDGSRPEEPIAHRAAPQVLFGTASLGSVDPTGFFDRRARRRAFHVLDEVYEAGCRGLDLARSYMAGGTERVVGDWLRATGVRESVFLLSKAGHPYPLLGHRLGTRALEADLAATLRALGVGQLDMLMLHRDAPEVSLQRLAADLARLVREGGVRATGVSNWSLDRIEALDAAGAEPVVAASSPQFSLAAWRSPLWSGCVSISGRANRYVRRRYRRASLRTFAYCPLGRGFLTGDATGRAGRGGSFDGRLNLERRARCERLGQERGASTAQVALAYLLCQPFPVHAVVKVSSGAHMRENLEAAKLALTEDDLRWLETGSRLAALTDVEGERTGDPSGAARHG